LFAIKSGFGWLSTIPVGISMEGIDALMTHVYVFPFIGLVLGVIFGIWSWLVSRVLPVELAAIAIIIVIYKLCGINHIDGLADFGDGIVAHGPIENKVKAMKDLNLGTGGVIFLMVLIISYFAIISNMPILLMPLAMVASEVSAKQSMVTFSAFSVSLQKGFGQIMIEKTDKRKFLISLIFASLFSVVILGPLGLVALAASQVMAIYLIDIAKKKFGGSTGDVIGAANEISRGIALATCLTLGGVVPWTLW
jgi:adenosylcobinamide-GDP ribazoletransferase